MASVPAIKIAAAPRTMRLRNALLSPHPKRLTPQPLHVLALFSLLLLAIHHVFQPRFAPNRPHLVTLTHGGLGNQIYFLLESLLLSRHAHLVFVPPTVPQRNIPGLPHQARDQPAHLFWNLATMNHFTDVAHPLPDACRRGYTAVYMARRGSGPIAPSRRLIRTACLYSGGSRPQETEEQCGQRALDAATLHKRYLNFTAEGDHSLIHELRNLQRGCVVVDGHSFSHSGTLAQEYLHSALHYVQASPYIANMLSKWQRKRMTVLHIRYDEYLCDKDRPYLCIRRTLSTNNNDTVVYVQPRQFVAAVSQLMRSKHSSHIYIAASPYTPPSMLSALDYLFSNHTNVLPRVSGLDETTENFLERELAIQAHVFVGDFASTWSGTVYYKRRTLGKATEWSCKLANKCDDLAHYRYNERLETPQWFEKQHRFSPSG